MVNSTGGVNVFQGAVVLKTALTDFFGFGYDGATPTTSTRAQIIYVEASPNGAVSAPNGSLAMRGDAGNASLFLNTDGAMTWTAYANP